MSSTFRPTGAELTENPIVGMIQELRGMAKQQKQDKQTSLSEVVEDTLDNILSKKKANDD
jgi:hypothetical protein